MKHQAKQSLAWVIALTASASLYAGGAWWLKHAAHGHGEESHDSAETSTSHQEAGGEHEVAEHEEHSEHGENAAHEEHASTEHVSAAEHSEHAEEHGAKEEHHATHEEHAAKEEHRGDSKHAEHNEHAAKEEHNAVAEHEEHAAKDEHAEVAEKKSDDHKEHKEHKETTEEKHPAGHNNAAPHWSYAKNEATGPAHWGDLNAQFSQCEKGREQSPIDLRGAVTKASAPHISWHYDPTAVTVENNGHTIVSTMPNGQNHIMIDGEKFTLAQFHFHSPSEHRIAGIPAEMELHFVHKNDKGALAVVGVMIQEKAGSENPFFKPLWKILPRELSSKAEGTPTMNLAKLLPTHRDYFNYAGSLTTPPCSQGVRWFVLKDPITMNGSQVEFYSSIFGGPTNRPVQPLFGRELIQNAGPAMVGH